VRLLIVAAPMVSRGGVYSWLCDTTSILREQGWTIGVLWTTRVAAEPPPCDWEVRIEEAGGRLSRVRALPKTVRAAMDDFQPDRVLSILPQSDLACAQTLKGAQPWTAMVHGRPYPAPGEGSRGRRLAWRAAVRWAYGRADRIVAVSEALGEALHDDLGLASVSVVHNGVHVPPALGRPREGRTVGFLGRLSVEKAPDLFLEIVRHVACDARVFGEGPLAQSVRASAAHMDNVTVEGWTDRDEALERIDLLVLSSRREALPLSCIEAGARGVPVLARDVGGVREILGEDPELRRHCILPADATPEQFGKQLTRLLEDIELRRDLGFRLRETVIARFALPRQALRLSQLLEDHS
jgi:glycosyltransferase involved in cell wall biosynthesis